MRSPSRRALTLLLLSSFVATEPVSAGQGVTSSDAPSSAGRANTAQPPRHPADCGLVPGAIIDRPNPRDAGGVGSPDGREVDLGVFVASPDDPLAMASLNSALAGKALTLWRQPATDDGDRNGPLPSDRYGRFRAHVTVGAGRGLWLQSGLIEAGAALVRLPHGLSPAPCTRHLMTLEAQARAAARGHWSSGRFRILKAERPQRILAEVDRFAIVEGTVHRVSQSRRGLYVNFGRDWRRDFTVLIDRRLLEREPDKASKHGDANEIRKGDRIRVRGWVEDRGGPLIEVSDWLQIERPSANGS